VVFSRSVGSSAPYPLSLITSIRRRGVTDEGSKSTVAELVIRFTLAPLTPGVLSSACWTRLLQPAQCIPDTGMVQVVEVAIVMVSAGR
jgi:hypothetical protein